MIQTTQQPRLFHPLEHLWDLIHLRRRIRQLQPQVPQTSGGGAAELKKKVTERMVYIDALISVNNQILILWFITRY